MSEADRHEQDFGGKYTQANALTRRLLNRFFLAIGKLLEELEVESALEIGCGFGFSTARLREMLAPEVALEASDVEERRVRAAAAANPGMPIRLESTVPTGPSTACWRWRCWSTCRSPRGRCEKSAACRGGGSLFRCRGSRSGGSSTSPG